MRVRQALALSAADRYASLLIGAVVLALVSRILTPTEVGITILGMTLFALVDIVRDVPTIYLVQRQEMSRDAGRAAFSVMLLVSVVAALSIFLAAPALARYEGDEGLTEFFRVLALALLIGPFERPLTALLRRNMAFDKVALVNLSSVVANAVTMVGLALLGFSFMSYAWAVLGSGVVALLVAVAVSEQRQVIGLVGRGWKEAIHIGGASGLWGLISRFTEALPHIVFGLLGQLGTLGLYGRAQAVADMPGKLIYAAIWPVALPALAARRREGESLKGPVLTSVALLSAVQWPALLVLACLAHPITLILLGSQWIEVVPAAQLLILARLLAPLDVFVYPVLMTEGRTRRLLASALIPLPVYALVIALAAPHGLLAIAMCSLLLVPVYSVVGYFCIRGPLGLRLPELLAALRDSLVVAAAAAAGPAAIIALHGFRFDITLPMAALAVLLALAGWSAALVLARHPLSGELRRFLGVLRQRAPARLGARP